MSQKSLLRPGALTVWTWTVRGYARRGAIPYVLALELLFFFGTLLLMLPFSDERFDALSQAPWNYAFWACLGLAVFFGAMVAVALVAPFVKALPFRNGMQVKTDPAGIGVSDAGGSPMARYSWNAVRRSGASGDLVLYVERWPRPVIAVPKSEAR
jgi:hypothetical protein